MTALRDGTWCPHKTRTDTEMDLADPRQQFAVYGFAFLRLTARGNGSVRS